MVENALLTRYLSTEEVKTISSDRSLYFPFSSTRPVERYAFFDDNLPEGASHVFDEVLSHDVKAWNLERVNTGVCPFLKNHNRDSKLGKVTAIEFKDDRAYASVKLSRVPNADQLLNDLEDGTAGGVSFGYSVQKYRVVSPAEYEGKELWDIKLKKKAVLEAIEITLYEVSAEEMPADPSVGFGRSDNRPINLRAIAVEGDPNWQRAKSSDLEKGSLVTWSSSGGKAYGRIEKKQTSGTLKPSEGSVEMDCSEDNPGFLCRNYVQSDDGWEKSETTTVHRASALQKIENFPTKNIEQENKKMTTEKELESLRSQVEIANKEAVSYRSQFDESRKEADGLRIELKTATKELESVRSQLVEKDNQINNLQRSQTLKDKYNSLRSRGKELLEETKITAVEFSHLFDQSERTDVERLLKSDNEATNAELMNIDFYLNMSAKRSPLLNTQIQAPIDEPATRTVVDEKVKASEASRDRAKNNYESAWKVNNANF